MSHSINSIDRKFDNVREDMNTMQGDISEIKRDIGTIVDQLLDPEPDSADNIRLTNEEIFN